MALRVLGLLGSPCTDGNTAALLDAVLEGARAAGAETERIDLARLNIHPCYECRGCDSEGACVRATDDMPVIYSRVRLVDAIVLASPIFFMGVTAQTKAMIDRCQCFWVERFVLKRRHYEGRRRPKGLFVSCAGGSKMSMFDPAIHVVRAFFSALDFEYAGEILLPGTDAPDIGLRRSAAIEAARAAGSRVCQ
ncbi:MAG: flavodoxin family protein [Thermoplasmata archaeon]